MIDERAHETWLKKRLPKSLFGRALLIIMLPIALMQIIVAYIFFQAHWQTVTASLSNSVAADISVAHTLYLENPSSETAVTLDAMLRPKIQLSVKLYPDAILPTAKRRAFFSSLDKTLRNALSHNIDTPFWFDTTRYPHYIDIRLRVDEGVLRFYVPRERVFAPTGFVFLFWLLMTTVLLSLVSILFILNQARPIVRLANAAEDFGKGRGIGNFKPSGAAEVRQAGRSFLEMRERLLRHVQQRTSFLAGVSHDLRTPLTRLNLHLSMTEQSEDTIAAQKDVKDMALMLDGYLDFARDNSQETIELSDIGVLLTDLVSANNTPIPILRLEGDLSLNMREIALKRALSNLIDNAKSYSKNIEITAKGSAKGSAKSITLAIDDDGPGIPKSERLEALKPFSRLDTARNQNRKGVGLGLSIANDIIQAHGGTLQLLESPMKGLRCQITLPK
ncbi:MAG: two-component sensor histidine kinase [Robiginitomaculum sp.]|nr:MAG: two-component sensor histidine kinase [Robiginitomaculum sp.]